MALLSVLLSKSPLVFMFFLSPPRLSKSVQARSWAGFGTSRTWMGAGGIQDSTMLPDEIWFVVEKIKVGGVDLPRPRRRFLLRGFGGYSR